jgi:hypothetical protein
MRVPAPRAFAQPGRDASDDLAPPFLTGVGIGALDDSERLRLAANRFLRDVFHVVATTVGDATPNTRSISVPSRARCVALLGILREALHHDVVGAVAPTADDRARAGNVFEEDLGEEWSRRRRPPDRAAVQ